MDEKQKFIGTVTLKDREKFEMDCVESVATFDEDYLQLNTRCGMVTIEGDGMKIESLLHDTGKIVITGRVDSISFDSKISKRGIRGIFS